MCSVHSYAILSGWLSSLAVGPWTCELMVVTLNPGRRTVSYQPSASC